ncbi:MAG TPA: AI-2E family transporter [Candidatus Sulfotelmatobacter sp.]
MARPNDATTSSKSLLLIAFVLAIAALYFGRGIFIPLALALILSFLLTPFVTLLQKIRFGRVPAVLTVLALSLALVGAVTWGVAAQLVEIMIQLPEYKDNLDAKIQALHTARGSSFSRATATLRDLNRELADLPSQIPAGHSEESRSSRSAHPLPVQVAQPPSSIIQDLHSLLGPLAGPAETATIVIIFTLFMLVKREDLRNRAIRLAGRGHLHVMTQALDDAGRRLSRYLLLQCLVNATYGILFGIGLYFVGVPHALLWGVFTGVLRFVPYIGTLLAALMPVAMALAVFPGWHHAAVVFGIFVALELMVSNFVEPLLYGAHTGISSLAILVAAVFWATIWGPVGLILSTPLTVCLVVLGQHFPQLSFLAVVLGDEPVLLPEQCFYQRLLAMDTDEARSICEAHLKTNSLESLYDSIILPALKLAEQDYEREQLDLGKRKFVLRSVRNLIEDLGDSYAEPENTTSEEGALASIQSDKFQPAAAPLACIAATSGADDLIAIMLTQLLQQAGIPSRAIRSASVERMVQSIQRSGAKSVCISSISPSSVAEARALCRRLRADAGDLRLVMGFWNLESGVAQQRLGAGCISSVVGSLAEAIMEVRQPANTRQAEAPEAMPQNLSV